MVDGFKVIFLQICKFQQHLLVADNVACLVLEWKPEMVLEPGAVDPPWLGSGSMQTFQPADL